MHTQTPTRIEDVRDPIGRERGPNGERTPMQWMPGPQAGFSSSPRTWLPVEDDYRTVNVRSEEEQPNSLLRWYKQLITLRRENAAFAPEAEMEVLRNTAPDVLAYVRTGADGKRVLVAMNMGAESQSLTLDLFTQAHHWTTLAVSEGGSEEVRDGLLSSSGQIPKSPEKHVGTLALPPFSVWILAAEADTASPSGKQLKAPRLKE